MKIHEEAVVQELLARYQALKDRALADGHAFMGVEPERFLEATTTEKLFTDIGGTRRLAAVRVRVRLTPGARRAWCLVQVNLANGDYDIDCYDVDGRNLDSMPGSIVLNEELRDAARNQRLVLIEAEMLRLRMAMVCIRRLGDEATATEIDRLLDRRRPYLTELFRLEGSSTLRTLLAAAPEADLKQPNVPSGSWVAVSCLADSGRPMIHVFRLGGTEVQGWIRRLMPLRGEVGFQIRTCADGQLEIPREVPNPVFTDLSFDGRTSSKIVALPESLVVVLKAHVAPRLGHLYSIKP